ncbi:MAG: site-specific DNA-methyltransferase [Paludibacteraceae bacterium]|nr:site-specific DNA-methyltransferase [Paludibacteraceae bacterium]
MHNRSHSNSGLMQLNRMHKDGIKHKSSVDFSTPSQSYYVLQQKDCLELLKEIPDESVQLILIDPPYNLDLAEWDKYDNYIDWASAWIRESYRVLSPNGSMVVFGGTQFQNEKSGDLIELIHYCRHNTDFRLVNMVVWYYKNGMSAHRYFANRHEEAIWLTKSSDYYFDLDSVRVPYGEKEMQEALRDKRLVPENVMKGKNPTNVWEIGRLNGNSLERVGHPTQKPLEIIRRFVKALAYPGSVVLDFFAGSGTTGRVCIEENRHCIMCDKDEQSRSFFAKHLKNIEGDMFVHPYIELKGLNAFWEKVSFEPSVSQASEFENQYSANH